MTPWFILVVLVIGCALFDKSSRWTGYVAFAITAVFLLCRSDSVGTDTVHYIEALDNQWLNETEFTFNIGQDKGVEILYWGLVQVVNKWSLWDRTLPTVYGLVLLLAMLGCCRRFKLSLSMQCLFYVLGFMALSMNISRQVASVMVLLYGSYWILEERNLLKYLLCVVVAGMFHMSSLVYAVLIIVPYCVKFFSKNALAVLMVISLLIGMFFDKSIEGLILPRLNLDDNLIYTDVYEYSVEGRYVSFVGWLVKIINFAFSLFVFYTLNPEQKKANVYELMFAVAVIIKLLFMHSGEVISRITLFFSVYSVMYYAMYFTKNKIGNPRNAVLFIAYTLFTAVMMFNTIMKGSYEVVPYQFLWYQ